MRLFKRLFLVVERLASFKFKCVAKCSLAEALTISTANLQCERDEEKQTCLFNNFPEAERIFIKLDLGIDFSPDFAA